MPVHGAIVWGAWEGKVEMTAQQKGVLEQLELMIKAGNDLNSALVKLQVMGISSELLDEVAAIRQRIIDVNRPGFVGGSGYLIPTPVGEACWAA